MPVWVAWILFIISAYLLVGAVRVVLNWKETRGWRVANQIIAALLIATVVFLARWL